jgi:haloalkane dehalogenase
MVNDMTAEQLYNAIPLELHKVKDAAIAVRRMGSGPNLIFIHGYPVNGYTWRKLLPRLSKHFTCIILDLPGLGDSQWNKNTDFTFTAQTARIAALLDMLRIHHFSLIAQNTGATLARMLALKRPKAVEKMVLFNTEIPGHRPPFIPLYQQLAKLPGAAMLCQYAIKSPAFIRSRFGFGQFYTDKKLFDDPAYLSPYLDRLKNSLYNVDGGLKYQDGIEWHVIDSLKQQHQSIKADTLLLWGENDKTFPVERAEEMSKQFGGRATFVRLTNASLMPQEEVPEKALEHIEAFLGVKKPAIKNE